MLKYTRKDDELVILIDFEDGQGNVVVGVHPWQGSIELQGYIDEYNKQVDTYPDKYLIVENSVNYIPQVTQVRELDEAHKSRLLNNGIRAFVFNQKTGDYEEVTYADVTINTINVTVTQGS